MSTSIEAENPSGRRSIRAVGLGDLFDLALLILTLYFLGAHVIQLWSAEPSYWDAALLFGLNGLAGVVGFMVALRRGYPILLACFYFDYIFFSIAPLQQLRFHFDPIFGDGPSFYTAISLSLMFSVVGLLALVWRGTVVVSDRRGAFNRTVFTSSFFPLILFIVTSIDSGALIALFGRALISSREAYFAIIPDKPAGLLFMTFLNPLCFYGAVLGLLGARQKGHWPWFLAFAMLLLVAEYVNNPLVIARFRASALFVFALLCWFGWNRTRIFTLFLLFGTIASPIANAFRVEHSTVADVRAFDRFFVHIDYDAFAMMAYIVSYVGRVGYSYGSNILSAILFFVPRALWPDKSEHPAHYVWPMVRYYRDVWTDNLSSPPPGEGYFAFGFGGAIVLTVVIFALFVWLERKAEVAENASPWRLIACVCAMLSMILLRGPLIVGVSEIIGNIVALLTAVLLLRIQLPVLGNKYSSSH